MNDPIVVDTHDRKGIEDFHRVLRESGLDRMSEDGVQPINGVPPFSATASVLLQRNVPQEFDDDF